MSRPWRLWVRDVAAASAVEFAFIAPMFLALVFGIVMFGSVLGIYHGVQQLVSESARASVAGLTDAERDQLARSFISSNIGSYLFLDPSKTTVSTSANSGSTTTFTVSIQYDMSNMFIYKLSNLLPLPNPTVSRSAVVQRGGY